MSRFFGTASLLALAALAVSLPSPGEVPPRVRVTIRGTGNQVTIDRAEASIRKPPVEKASESLGVLGHATDLKLAGADDSTLIAYIRAHQAELPQVIDARDVRQLRRAGAGKAVVAFLATVSAVDIGETGEGREPAAFYPAPVPEAPMYGMPYGYAAVGGYAGPHLRHRVFPPHRVSFHPRHSAFPVGLRPLVLPTVGAITR